MYCVSAQGVDKHVIHVDDDDDDDDDDDGSVSLNSAMLLSELFHKRWLNFMYYSKILA